MSSETIPVGIFGHCSVKFSEDTFYVMGGVTVGTGPGNKVYRWDIGVAWIPLAPLLTRRSKFGCTLVTSSLEIVAAAGRTNAWGRANTVEIYNIASNQWRYGTAVLPADVWTCFTRDNTVWALGDAPGMTYWYDYDGDQWIHENDIIMNGVPENSHVLLDEDDTFKCS